MNAKIMSFEEYANSKGLKATDEITESCDACGQEPCICETEEVESTETEEEETETEEEETETEEEETEEKSDDAKENAEEADSDEEEEEVEEKVKTVSEMMKECYSTAVKEACEYHKDDYPDHTLESYLKENAALAATLACETLENAHALIESEDLTVEMYEACLNNIKESYNKKINELKEAWSSK